MTRKSRRIWFGATIAALIALAVAAHIFAGGGMERLARHIHGQP